MRNLKGLIKSLINGMIGVLIATAFATAFHWNLWLLGILGYITGWLLLSESFWEGIDEAKQELAEENAKKVTKERTEKGLAEEKKEDPIKKSRYNLAQTISVIICLLVSPFILIYLIISVKSMHEVYQISIFWGITICIIVGLIALNISLWILEKSIYFIIK